MSSMGGSNCPRVPRRILAKLCCGDVNSRRASASVSALLLLLVVLLVVPLGSGDAAHGGAANGAATSLHHAGGVFGLGNRRHQGRESGKGGDQSISHWCWLRYRKWFGVPDPRAVNEHERRNRHCWRNRDKIMQTPARLARLV